MPQLAQSETMPPLPPGFTLDTPAFPPPPPGFVLDKKPTFVPVDGDPFAQAAPPVAAPKLVPVEGDPFAQQPPVAPAGPPAPSISTGDITPSGRLYIGPQRAERPASILPSSVGGAIRDFQVGSQGVGAGLKHLAAAPFDLMAGAQNLVTGGVNKLFGTNIPYATPASKLVDMGVGKANEALGHPLIDPAEMSNSEKLAYDVNDFGTQGLLGGAALAQRAPAMVAQTTPSQTLGGRIADTLARPYLNAPARTVAGDTIGGLGAGIAKNAADELPDDAIVFGHRAGHWPKAIVETIAPLVGAGAANTLQSAGEGIGGLLRNFATRTLTSAPAPIPLNPATKAPYANADVDRAATRMQAAATGAPRALAEDIRENAAGLTAPSEAGASPVDMSGLPTSGLLSRDPGLLALEQGGRLKRPADFIQRDQNIKAAAAERIEAARDPDAEIGAVFRRAGEARSARLAPAESDILQREEASRAIEDTRQDQGARLGLAANTEARANASRELDRALVDESYVPARTEKNRLFDTAPGRHDQLPADDVFTAIDRVRAGANGLAPGTLPHEFLQRLDRLRPRIDPDSGENLGGLGTASGVDLADLRKYLGTAQAKAQQGGNFDLADNIGRLRFAINRTITDAPGYGEANGNYSQFAQRFRPERSDEMAQFTRELDRGGQQPDGTLNRGATPPSETATRFLNSPEKAATLSRALDGMPAAAQAYPALRDFLRSGFATSALNPDGTLNPIRANSWAKSHADILAQFPGVRAEFDDIIATARRGEQMSTQARADLEAARAQRNATETEIDRSAIGTLIREDPRDVALKLLNGGYGAEKRLDEINALVRNDEQAKRGWKAAVAGVLVDRVQSTRQVGEIPEIQFARLAKEFKDNEPLLVKTFSPEEMNNLRQAHTLLSYFKEAEKRATVGSDTAEKWGIPGWAQLAVRHFKGERIDQEVQASA